MSLADELMELAGDFSIAALVRGRAPSMANANRHRAARDVLRERFVALESELNDLKKLHNHDLRIDPATLAKFNDWQGRMGLERLSVPPRVESHNSLVSGLPCPGCGVDRTEIPNPYGQPGTFWNCYNPECSHIEQPPELPVENDLGISEGAARWQRYLRLGRELIEQSSGLPCSNPSDWTDETGG